LCPVQSLDLTCIVNENETQLCLHWVPTGKRTNKLHNYLKEPETSKTNTILSKYA